MATFPLNEVPPLNLIQILGKMGYREATRMRRSCRDIDEFIDSNRQCFKFPVERVTFLFDLSDTKPKKVCKRMFEMNFPKWWSMRWRSPHDGIPDNGLFKSISIVCLNPYSISTTSWSGQPILKYIEKTNIRCHRLNIMKKLANRVDLVELYKACKASTVFVGRSRHGGPDVDKPIPLQLGIVEQLSSLKCPTLVIELCDELPYEYAEILSQFQVINIVRIKHRRSHSLAPLLKLMVSECVFPLKSFLLPVYSDHLSAEEIVELQMEKWRLKQNRHHWCGHRIPKSDIELLVSKWISHYHSLPIDGSSLYEYIWNKQENYDGIKAQMETLLDKSYPTTAPSDFGLYYMC